MSKLEKFSDVFKKRDEIAATVRKLREELSDWGKKALEEALEEIFAEHPSLQYVSWTQYTPYFNDGEVCRFRSNHDWPDVNYDDYDDELECEPATEADEKALTDFLGQFSNDDMEDIFGDGYRIAYRRDSGLDVEDWDHD